MARSAEKIRRLFLRRGGELLLMLVLVGLVAFLFGRIQDVRRMIIEERFSLEQDLSSMTRDTALEAELSKRQHDISRIASFVVRREMIGEVVGALEREAGKYNVSLRIPDIEEEVRLDEEGQPVEASGFVEEVRLRAVATGKARDTLRFLHAVEYQPFLLGVAKWQLVVGRGEAPAGSTAYVPRSGPTRLSNSLKSSLRGLSYVEMDIIVTTLRDQAESSFIERGE